MAKVSMSDPRSEQSFFLELERAAVHPTTASGLTSSQALRKLFDELQSAEAGRSKVRAMHREEGA